MIVDRIQREHRLTALAHLTCVNHTRDEVRIVLDKIRALGCQNILGCCAVIHLPPANLQKTPGGFEFFLGLVRIHPAVKTAFPLAWPDFPEVRILPYQKGGKLPTTGNI